MNTHQHVFLKAVMAGVYIGIAGLIYLSLDNKVIGSLMFSFGLLVVVTRGYYLYTGKVGYLLPYPKGYLWILLKTLFGNLVGIATIAFLFRLTGISSVVIEASSLYEMKLSHLWYETLVLSIFCGMMMYIAVDSFVKVKHDFAKIMILVFAVMIFILAKFEHSIANMLYLFLSDSYSVKSFMYLIIMITGNGIGGVILNLVESKLDIRNQV